MPSSPCVLLIADMPLWSTGVAQALRGFYPDLEFVCAGSGREALGLAHGHRFDALVADLCLSDMHAFELLRELRAGFRLPPALLFGEERELGVCNRTAATRAGARAFLSRRASLDELREAMDGLLAGQCVLPVVSYSESLPTLTARELEVLHGLAEGLSNRALGARLHVAETTLKTHLRSLYQKLAVKNRTACVAAARRQGLL